MMVVEAGIFWALRGKLAAGYADFTSFYGAGLTVRQGHGRQLYDPAEQWRTQQQFAKDVAIRQQPLPYLRLPFEALTFTPLTLFPYPVAYGVWFLINLGVAVGVALFLRREQNLDAFPAWLAVLVTLAFVPIFLSLLQGQDSIFVLLFYSLAFAAMRRGADFRAGCSLGLGMIKPHLVVPFVILALLRGKYRFTAGFLSVAGVLLLVSWGVAGSSALAHYPGYLWELEQHPARGLVVASNNPNLRGLVEGFGSGLAPPSMLAAVIALLSAALLVWVIQRTQEVRGTTVVDWIFCQFVIAAVLVSYHAFIYDLSVLLLPIFLLAAQPREKPSAPLRWALIGPVVVLLCGPVFALLWLKWNMLCLLALVLLVWLFALDREIAQRRRDLPAQVNLS